MPDLNEIKKELHKLCVQFVEKRIAAAEHAIKSAQESANEESKSSMGDKYETGRAMAQLEIEKDMVQLVEAQKLKRVLEHLNPASFDGFVQIGSLVLTDNGNYYVAIGAGKFLINGVAYFAVSPISPVGQKIMTLQKGSAIEMNGKKITIELVI